MRAAPQVSVVIPTRDRWELLSRHALPSALSQEGVPLEVIVVDDGSRESTSERLAALGDDRLRWVRIEPSRGVAHARNVGIELARGEWVALLDDDDLWSPAKLATQLQVVGDAGWCFCSGVVVDERLRVLDTLEAPVPEELEAALRRGNVVAAGSSAVIVRTGLLRSLGGYDAALGAAEDWDLWFRLAHASPAARCGEILVATVDHSERSFARDPGKARRGVDTVLLRVGADRDARRSAAEWLASEQYRVGRRGRAAAEYLRVALAYRSPGNAVAAAAALFGDGGMRVAHRLLGGGVESHVNLVPRPPAEDPAWLSVFRARAVHG